MQLCYRIEIFICIYLLSEVIWLIPKPWKVFICTEQSKWTKQRRYPSIVCNWVCLFVHYLFMNAHLVCGSLHILYTTVDQKFSTHKIWHLNSWLIGKGSKISEIKTVKFLNHCTFAFSFQDEVSSSHLSCLCEPFLLLQLLWSIFYSQECLQFLPNREKGK